jgi:primosomal protein N' (replication factor Y)
MIKYVNIALPLPLRKVFTYSLELDNDDIPVLGKRAVVVFNRRKTSGFIVSSSDKKPDMKLSKVIEIPDDRPLFSIEMLEFCRWISEYYICGYGEVLKLALPQLLLSVRSEHLISTGKAPDRELSERENMILGYIEEFSPAKIPELEKAFGKDVKKDIAGLCRNGYAKTETGLTEKNKEILLKAYVRTEKSVNESELQNEKIITLLKHFETRTALLNKDIKKEKISPAAVNTAVNIGLIEEKRVRKDHFDSLFYEKIIPAPALVLNDEQKTASEIILESAVSETHRTFLLHGITGSGKTAVYISVVSEVLRSGRSAIIMVPEISLTTQTVRNFRSHFGDNIALLHSKMSDFERLESWQKIKSGEYRIVIGPRSAVFAPVDNLGVIIVDEEHDSSYKQSGSSPRYCARNSAVMRGYLNSAPVVLGSATPSVESYHNALTGKYVLLGIKKRFSTAVLPETRIVKRDNPYMIFEDKPLHLISEELALGRKVIVLQNRRGYSSQLVCRSCGATSQCPNCSVSLTYHLSAKQMICHHCGYFEKGKDTCSNCGGDNVYFKGAGTEQVEEELKRLFPEISVLRMDFDTTRNKDGHRKILDMFAKPGAAILVGTKMIAKGLDFHDVSLVCVVNIDSELIFPDFRSDERAFQLIEQVAGRAGRGKIKGKVVVQTFNPDDPVIKAAASHDYHGFVKDETELREITAYPPFSRLIKITMLSRDAAELKKFSGEFYSILEKLNTNCKIYRPVEKMIHKVNNIFRLYILIKSLIITDRNGLKARKLVNRALDSIGSSAKIKIEIDVDPSDIM